MLLSAGDKLGPYEIHAPIGEGGMGEVYKARDTRLGRTVAIKTSKDQFSERFEREARAVAALNHPNICHLYDVGPNYLVMEFVEGESPKGPMPLEEALRIASQIADALEAAHEKGIVHRDLKPANIKITPDGTVKVLDFGLAKMTGPETASASPADSPTITMAAATKMGVILGTAGYMSPEQARGKSASTRADIWAFGVVLYELLTGRRTFHGENVTETLASIMKDQVDLSVVPFEVRRLLEACLEKDPKKRLQSIGDWGLLLDKPAEIAAASVRPKGALVGWIAAGVMGIAAAALAFVHFRETPPPAEPLRLSVNLPPDARLAYLEISPDGRRMVVGMGARYELYLRSLDSDEFRLLEETRGARTPFWSPDSRFIGFVAGGKLKVISAGGGPATALCGVTGLGYGGTWNHAGVILFGTDSDLRQVKASGGECSTVKLGENFRAQYPVFLPDGNHFLCYGVSTADLSTAGVYLASLDGAKPRKILNDPSSAVYSPPVSPNGPAHLIFLRGTTLMAQPFDPAKLEAVGDPFAVASQASTTATDRQMAASAAPNGTLIYAGNRARRTQLTWIDRSGKELGKVGEPADLGGVSLSPDGSTAASSEVTPADPLGLLRLFDLDRDSSSQFTPNGKSGLAAVWSPDGARIVYRTLDAGKPNLVLKEANGNGQETPLLAPSTNDRHASDWSRDGRYLVYTEVNPQTKGDIWYLPDPGKAAGPGIKESKPVKFLATDSSESQGQLSPDGRWLAYCSNEGGPVAVYVRAFPSGGQVMKVADRAREPRWGKGGSELFYLAQTGRPSQFDFMVVGFHSGTAGVPRLGAAQKIAEVGLSLIVPEYNLFAYAVHPDGKRFLMNLNAVEAKPELNVILNWQRLAPKGDK